MKSKCSFILKASLSLVLALLMLFGTMATSIAAAVENAPAETDAEPESESHGAEGFFAAVRKHVVDLAETGDATFNTVPNKGTITVYFENTKNWSNVYMYIFNNTSDLYVNGWLHPKDKTESVQTMTCIDTTNKIYAWTGSTYYTGSLAFSNTNAQSGYDNFYNAPYCYVSDFTPVKSYVACPSTKTGTTNGCDYFTTSSAALTLDKITRPSTGNLYDVISGSKVMFYYGKKTSWGNGNVYVSSNSSTTVANVTTETYGTSRGSSRDYFYGYACLTSSRYYVSNDESNRTMKQMSAAAEGGRLYGLYDDNGNQLESQAGHATTWSSSSDSIEVGATSTTIAATAAKSPFNRTASVYYYINDGGTYKYLDSTTISGLSAGTYNVYAVSYDDQIFVRSSTAATLTVTQPQCTPTITIGDNTVYTKQSTSISVAHETGFSGGTISVTVKNSSNTDVTSSLLTTVTAGSSYTFNAGGTATAGTYTVTATCSAGTSNTATITVSDPGNIYFKHSTTSGNTTSSSLAKPGTGTEGQITMSYDATASAALTGGTASHVVYKATITNATKAKHYWLIYNNANKSNTTTISSNANRLDGGTGLAISNSSSNGTIDLSSIGIGDVTVYYDVIDNKFYAELPILVTYQGYCTAQSKNVGTAVTEVKAYGATATSGKTITATGYTQVTPVKWYTTNAMSTEYTFPALTGNITTLTIYTPMTANTYTVTLDKNATDATAGTASVTATYGAAMPSATMPTRTGYTFAGYYDTSAASGGYMYYKADGTSNKTWDKTSATTLYARWTEKTTTSLNAAAGAGGKITISGGSAVTSGTLAATGIATYQTLTATPNTGYTFTGWTVSGTNASNVKLFTDTGRTTAYTSGATTPIYVFTDGSNTSISATITANFTPKTTAITLSANGGTAGATTSITGTYDAAMPTIAAADLPTKTGYTFAGYYDATSGGTQYISADGTSAKNWDKTDATKTLYAHWSEIKYGATVKAYTNDSASGTGGNVSYNGNAGAATQTISNNTFGIDTASKAITAAVNTGYEFKGWRFNNTNLKYSFDGTTFNAVASTSTTYGTSADTTVYLKTDGTASLSGLEVWAMFESAKYTITYSGKYTNDGTTWNNISSSQGEFTVTNNSDSNANVASGTTVSYQNKLTITATPASGYVVDGIYYRTSSTGTWELMETATNASTGAVYNNNFNVESNWFFEARFRKVYYLSLYNTWENIGTDAAPQFRYISSPPMRVNVTPAVGDAYTYVYKKSTSSTSEGATRTGGGDYNEGDLLTVYAGDTVDLHYASLASSDTITGVFFNNSRRYTTDNEPDNKYINRVLNNGTVVGGADQDKWYVEVPAGQTGDDDWQYDYLPATTLFADEYFYDGATATTIHNNKTSYQAQNGVDNNTHTVTFTVTQDYKNIDLELATKRRFIFVDSTGVDIRSETMDNYYDPMDAVSDASATTKFGIKLASSETCTYDWGTGEKATFWQDAACTVAEEGITLAPTADAAGYFVISGTMPNRDVYVKLNIETKFSLYLGSRMVSDTFGNFDSFGDVASYYIKNAAGTSTLLTGRNDTANVGPYLVTQGESGTVKLTYTFKDRSGMGWTGEGPSPENLYSFIGWYKGDSSGPDYAKGKINTKNGFNFIPKENTYIYAVCTRDVYINGSKNITGASTDWNTVDSVDQNFKMDFDPDYINPDGGARGRYYWVVKPEWFAASGTGGVGNFEMGSYQNDSTPYWNDNGSNHGNSYFQFRDTATGSNDKLLWSGIGPYVSTKDYIKFGKIDPRDQSDSTEANKQGLGVIKFKESDYPGYTAPITIYYYPGHGFSVEPTPMYSNLYVSNGFNVGSTLKTSATTVTVPTGETSFTITNKKTYNPSCEGTVTLYVPEKKNAKVRITKPCSATEKVVAFDVYDLDSETFYSITDVTASDNNYYIDFECTMQQNLYFIPIIQEKSADLTINFDGSQMNKKKWGKIVTAYAWYSDGSSTKAFGDYPGQPMVVSSDGNTWKTSLPSTKNGCPIVGILFTNYVDGDHSWLGCTGVMSTVTHSGEGTSSSPMTLTYNNDGLINEYNYIQSGDYNEYSRANCKAQTYDYREPIAIYENSSHESGVTTTLTFAMKDGNSNLLSRSHDQLTHVNILTLENTTDHSTYTWSKLKWEYLTNSTGKKYADLNGRALETKPSASYYIAAKGQVMYNSNALKYVFNTGKQYDDVSSLEETYGGTSDIVSFNYAVQWYIYDAEGNYITNVLSAAFADQAEGMSYISKLLDDKGYPVEGRSVAVCYDKPRYMYGDDDSKAGAIGYNNKHINTGDNFDAYRFTGQWYATIDAEPVTVSVGVGMNTENGEVLADNNHPGYGDATAEYSTTYGTASYAHSNDGDKSVTVALADASKRLVKLDANPTNFVGWYYYDVNTNEFTKASYTKPNDFYPEINADVTYYAMYEAKAVYQYNYTGREGEKTYSVAGGAMTDAEMADGNRVATTRTDFGSKSPGSSDITIFKKDIHFDPVITSGMLNNSTPYIMNINNATITDAEYIVTAHFKKADGSSDTKAKTAVYNTPVDFTTYNENVALTTAYANASGKKFIGWFECDENGENIGNLLSTQANYGMVVVKTQHIIAVYEGEGKTVSNSDAFTLFADDHEITREKYSESTGTYYNDTIIRLRNGSTGNLTSLPSGAEVGILIINANDSGQSTVVSNEANLTNFATNLTNGQTAAVGTRGRTVTKISTTTLNSFGRADLAMRCDYGTVNNKAYSVYAYYKNPSGAYTFVTVREGGLYTID